jgi:hypothetical protein
MREVTTSKDMNVGKMIGASSFRRRLISNYTPIVPNVIIEGLQMMLHTNYHLLDQPDELQLLHFVRSRRALRAKGAAVADHDVGDERSFHFASQRENRRARRSRWWGCARSR